MTGSRGDGEGGRVIRMTIFLDFESLSPIGLEDVRINSPTPQLFLNRGIRLFLKNATIPGIQLPLLHSRIVLK
jgi:hypothetical protein